MIIIFRNYNYQGLKFNDFCKDVRDYKICFEYFNNNLLFNKYLYEKTFLLVNVLN